MNDSPNNIYELMQTTCMLLSHDDLKVRYGFVEKRLFINYNYVMLWFKKGVTLCIGGKKVSLEANSVCFISPLQVGYFLSEIDEEIEEYALFVPESFFEKNASKCGSLIKHLLFSSNDGFKICKVGEGRVSFILQMLDDLYAEQKIEDNWSKDRVTLLVTLILVDLGRYGSIEEIKTSKELSGEHDLFVKFIKCVEQNFRECHSVKEYMCKLGVSQAKLNESVKKYSGRLPNEIISARLIQEAKQELLDERNNINEIAVILGFSDTSNFIKYFKKKTGETPLEYRRKYARK